MSKAVALCVIIPFVTGCAALSKGVESSPVVDDTPVAIHEAVVLAASEPLPPKKPKEGFIIGRTDFKGLLKAPYVRLLIQHRENPVIQYYFYVGSKGNQSVVPWAEGRVIEPGYFSLQLPPGPYKITSIAIPVGSTLAEEDMELDFDVIADHISYVGALDVEGTREKVKFGGVPLIRPGFVYTLSVIDEFSEAEEEAQRLLPEVKAPLIKNLFVIVSVSGGDISSSNLSWPVGEK